MRRTTRHAFVCVLFLFSLRQDPAAAERRLNTDHTAFPQGETTLAVNPNDADHLVAAWIDWGGNPGQGVTTYHARSLDGGATWSIAATASSVSPVTPRVDPALTFDGMGNIYALFATVDPDAGLRVLKSTDGGLTFGSPVVLDGYGADKPWIAADPSTNAVYVVWQRITGGIWFSRSIDMGATFSSPVLIEFSASLACVAVGPGGEVYVSYDAGATINIDRSLDGGVTWLGSDLVGPTISIPAPFVNGNLKNTFWPNLTVDRSGGVFDGRLRLVWADGRNGDSDIYFAQSADQGATWTPPVRVNNDYVGGGTDQVLPWVWTDELGHVHVQWLDRRNDPDNLLFETYMATSTNGGNRFLSNVRVSQSALPQGGLPLSLNSWIGDYNGAVGAGGQNHVIWADGRNGDLDIFFNTIDDADFDDDGILNDGNGDGQYGNLKCTGGATTSCDDNCDGVPNPLQEDTDGDRVGDFCDNCPLVFATSQEDRDRDGVGDACDPCPDTPHAPAGDPDGDGEPECTDNCPGVPNAGQADADSDGLGDACDPCPLLAANDTDGDGVCDDVDNCAARYNPEQADSDGDGVGNLCDVCPAVFDPGQADLDADGRGDACDCQPGDLNDLNPVDVPLLRTFLDGKKFVAGWVGNGLIGPGSSGNPGRGFDRFSVTRGLLSDLHASGSLGNCFQEGVLGGFEDADIPPQNDGYFYLVQGQNFDCGLGSLGFDSAEVERQNISPGVCVGQSFSDVFASGESTVLGTVSGSLADTLVSDDSYETITEVLDSGDSHMEHRWTFNVPAGSQVELHFESAFTTGDSDAIILEYSTDGVNFTLLTPELVGSADPDRDNRVALPPGVSGLVTLRVIDTRPGAVLDSYDVDQLWIRSVP